MRQKQPENLNKHRGIGSENCPVCNDLMINMQHFFDMIDTSRRLPESDWLTVDEIARELRISKTIVYRLIRSGELEAVNIVENQGKIAQRGHYRIKRKSLDKYLAGKKVRPLPEPSKRKPHTRHFPKIKNHLGL